MLYLLGASKNIYGYADSYLTIYLCGTLFVMLSLGMNAFINARGLCQYRNDDGIDRCSLQPDFGSIFIFEMKMGVQGAALATVISQFAAACWTLRFLTGKKATIRLDKNYLKLKTDASKRFLYSVYPVLLCR